MHLDINTILPYRGGQIEVHNAREDYLFRGQINKLILKDDVLIITLAWITNARGHAQSLRWVRAEVRAHQVKLEEYELIPTQDASLRFQSPSIGELIILSLPGVRVLNPQR